MAITSLDTYLASTRQNIEWFRSTTRTTTQGLYYTVFDLAGQAGGGTLAGSSTAAGVVPDSTVTGYPPINTFAGGTTGYLTRVNSCNTVTCRLSIFDRLFLAGAYAFNASATLSSQPSYSARIPNGDYSGTELWVEAVTAFTGTWNVAITYTNQAGTTGRSTGTFSITGAIIGRAVQLPLAAGDTGVQKIESVTATTASAGTFNVMVLRPLFGGRVPNAGGGDVADLLKTGLPQVFSTSALYVLVDPDSTSSGVPELTLEIASG